MARLTAIALIVGLVAYLCWRFRERKLIQTLGWAVIIIACFGAAIFLMMTFMLMIIEDVWPFTPEFWQEMNKPA